MPALCTSRGVGQYVASEAHTLAYGRRYKADGTHRPVIYFTGGPGDDRDFLTASASGAQIAPTLAHLNVPIISAAFGGGNQWGNDTAQTRIGQAWTYVKTALGTRTDKFVGIGVSKGATALLNYTRNNPANVAALLLIVPAVNLTDIHDNNRSGLAASIETAYTNLAGWQAGAATHDPALNTATHASQAIPTFIFYGDGDTTVTPSSVTSFASAVGATAQQITGTDHLTTAPALNPVSDVWAKLNKYI